MSDDTQILRIPMEVNLLASTVEAERSRLQALLQHARGPVVLDLRKVEEIDSLGITLVLGTFKSCHKNGLPFSLEGVNPDLMRVFRLFSLPKLFPVKEI